MKTRPSLPERLRKAADDQYVAASAIERLREQVERLVEQVERLHRELKRTRRAHGHHGSAQALAPSDRQVTPPVR